ncbi:FxLD family lanthipeptide [Streptomyces sp. NPDC005898]|uniref:FxLD family lanthipeptide n=1 Tax=Streptomyces sp. NPDC005898 TaxID=3157082 RepID=UPI00340DCE1C
MPNNLKEAGPQTAPAARSQDPFDLDISVIESGGAVSLTAASEGGCAATCGNACVSSGA